MAYFLSRTGGDADRDRLVAAVVPQLAYLLDEEAPASPDEYALAELWERARQQAVRRGRQLLLVVDGLDENLRPGGHSVAGWSPPPGPGARVLVASRPHPELPTDVPVGHPLRATCSVGLPPFKGAQELADLARQEIDALTHGADSDLAGEVLAAVTAAAGPLLGTGPGQPVEWPGHPLRHTDSAGAPPGHRARGP